MVVGNTPRVQTSLLAPGYSIAAVIANEFTEVAGNGIYLAALFELALILFAIALVMNLIGRLLITRLAFHGKVGSDV
jgi:phosphate transport system permease protein